MAKKLDPKAIEAGRKKRTQAERREQKAQEFHDDINRSRASGGVIVIPPTKPKPKEGEVPRKLRVAAYCRVSTQEEEQVGSFEMQVHHFEERIANNPAWELVEIFKDNGISATTTLKRVGFQNMMTAALDGQIDLILTKSISRFGRNVRDILENLEKLSECKPPVTVEFEQENIVYSADNKNNLIITLLSALAELESQQKSEAIKAGIRWRMAEGIYKFSVKNTLGYYRDHFGRLVIEPTEAKIVEYIYESCLEGASPSEIATSLTEQGIKSPMGKDIWYPTTVRNILQNEKYCGDALMQKTYTPNFKTHKSVPNTELNKYLKEEHHAAIIQKSDWKKVQELLALRRDVGRVVTLRKLVNRFVAPRVKDGLFKGFFILDSRWTVSERRDFIKIINELTNSSNTKGSNDNEI